MDEIEEEAREKIKRVRHGNGIQLYGQNEKKKDVKYEGQWEKDMMHGEGIASFPDGSIYRGTFKQGQFDGYGRFEWFEGHVYEGNWREGRMEGGGEFSQAKGNELKGLFKGNYYNNVPHNLLTIRKADNF